ncbi:MAG TPA: hypothetical protein VG713_14880 [Pirellulales bacterium]|nr:hypothetical protein [Pirellulales bacterium]
MTLLAHLVSLVLIFVGGTVGPGLWIVRRTAWQPIEKLCAAVGFSWFLIYAASFALFATGANPAWNYAITGLAWIATIANWRAFWFLACDRKCRLATLAWCGLAAWCFLAICLVRTVGGGDWAGDWVEHYERAEFFLGHRPIDYKFIGLYLLPARLPLQNVLCSFFMAQVGTDFAIYQTSCILLGTLSVLPCLCWVLADRLTPAERTSESIAEAIAPPEAVSRSRTPRYGAICLVLTGLLALNPSFIQNLVFVWTKLFAAFYVVLGLYFYVQAWRGKDLSRMVAGFATLAVGLLVHHSTGVYILFLVVHYLAYLIWRRERRWLELALVATICTMILATWFAWSFGTYGVRDTLSSNYVLRDFEASTGGGRSYKVVALNWLYSFVPWPFHDGVPAGYFDQQNWWGKLRDQAFMIYQVNLLPMMGSFGGVLAVALLLAEPWNRRRIHGRAETAFWIAFGGIVPLLGVGVVFSLSYFGLAHNALQPLNLLGLTLVASRFYSIPRFLAAALLVGVAIDFAVGVWLHLHMDHYVFEVGVQNNQLVVNNAPGLSARSVMNWIVKEQLRYRFLGDRLPNAGAVLEPLLVLMCAAWLVAVVGTLLQGSRWTIAGKAGFTPELRPAALPATRRRRRRS